MAEFVDLLSGIAGKGGRASGNTKRGKFEASILTTYNAYLPFYEDVILRRLIASGCHHNILLIDASDMARSLQSPTLRPRHSGRTYTLVPMHAAGAFHPKIALLVGKKRARVFTGSHNSTLSGFGQNRELTTQIEITNGASDPNAPIAQAVWRFIDIWMEHQRDYLPSSLLSAVQNTARNAAPWLLKSREQSGSIHFLGATPSGDDLWQNVRQHLPDSIERISVLGPFYDREGAFLTKMMQELKPGRIDVGIEPTMVSLCQTDSLPRGIHFYDSSQIGTGTGYLHAKAIYFHGSNDQPTLITGSANPSRPAWTAPPSRRNAEAIVIQHGNDARILAEEIQVYDISTLPQISGEELARISVRSKEEHLHVSSSTIRMSVVAEACDGTLTIPASSISSDQVLRAIVICLNRPDAVVVTSIDCDDVGIHLTLPIEITPTVSYAEVQLHDGRVLQAIVHHPTAIANLSRTASQQRFKDALYSLDSDSSDLPTVIRLAKRMIFDSEDTPEQSASKSMRSRSPDNSERNEQLGPLSVSIQDTKLQKKGSVTSFL